eukprot:CAMPEP_0113526364 /NCGR_PEP_ID=MMETSP0015_2-20120614/696_1 /TAXON_ID=2838 /ORGANISM="Odontella" /LENGTH=360 /DNA_ID=CAMNT_0000424673 /DNA_START=49 /DNA_END=1131 /DNA_ORIENTATION=- /assembly_acc=CAM_ASM_000160
MYFAFSIPLAISAALLISVLTRSAVGLASISSLCPLAGPLLPPVVYYSRPAPGVAIKNTRLAGCRGFVPRPLSAIQVRDWREDDFPAISSLLGSSGTDFDPEGPLSADCGSVAAIAESYEADSGGCFLVANDDDGCITGTAALVVGTPVTYLKSGASVSTPDVTGAVRRVFVADLLSPEQKEATLVAFMNEIEERSKRAGVSNIIALAYSDANRPTEDVLEKLLYVKDVQKSVPGLFQFSKDISCSLEQVSKESEQEGNGTIFDVAIGTALVGVVAAAAFGFSSILGLGFFSSADNGGVGTPLSSQELGALLRDEKLQRTDLDGNLDGNIAKEWGELDAEERREEGALMNIISGREVRLK